MSDVRAREDTGNSLYHLPRAGSVLSRRLSGHVELRPGRTVHDGTSGASALHPRVLAFGLVTPSGATADPLRPAAE